MQKALKIIIISILLLILFRGFIYKLVIKYSEIGTRTEIKLTNKKLIERIENKSINRDVDLTMIIKIADEITNEELVFTMNRASNNPNELMETKEANCVGYSAMFNSISNYLIRKHNLESKMEAKHRIGQLKLFGINLHQFFDNSFFANHDFNDLIDKKTNEVISIDPSISDYLKISRIRKINK